MSYKCYKCGTYLVHSYDDCPNCAAISAGQKNAEKITSAISEANRANQLQAQKIAAAIDNANRVQLATAMMNLQIANEQATSEQDAYNSGYGLNFLTKSPRAFEGSLNDKGEINQLFFDKPYLMDKLNTAYENGVWDRIRAELNGQLLIPGAVEKFAEQAYSQGLDGANTLKFEVDVPFLINCRPTTKEIRFDGPSCTYSYDESCLYSFTPNSCKSPFTSPIIWAQYLKGIEKFVELKNSPAELIKRKEEFDKRKRGELITIISMPILYVFSIYMIYWLWTHNHGVFAALQMCAIGVAVSSFRDMFHLGILGVIGQAFLLSLALAAFGAYSYFF